jgi:hypothetical protein
MFLKRNCVCVSAVEAMSESSILALNFEWRFYRDGNENVQISSETTPNVLETEENGIFHAEFRNYMKTFRGSQLFSVFCTCLLILMDIKPF